MSRTLLVLLAVISLVSLAPAVEIERAKSPILSGPAAAMLRSLRQRSLPVPTELTKPGQAQIIAELGGAYRNLLVRAKPEADAQKVAEAVSEVIGKVGLHPESIKWDQEEGYAAVSTRDSDGKMWVTERTNSLDLRPLESKLREMGYEVTSVVRYRKHAKYAGESFPRDESSSYVWIATTGASEPLKITVSTPPAAPLLVFLFILFPGVCGVLGIALGVTVGRMKSIDIKKRRNLYPKIVYGFVFGSMAIHAPIFLGMAMSGTVRPMLDLWMGTSLMTSLAPALMAPMFLLIVMLPLANIVEKKLFGPDENVPAATNPAITLSPEEKVGLARMTTMQTGALFVGLALMFGSGLLGVPSPWRLVCVLVGGFIMVFGGKFAAKGYAKRLGLHVEPISDPGVSALAKEVAGRMGVNLKEVWVTQDIGDRASVNASVTGEGTIRVTRAAKEVLTDDEMRALLAHELAHVKLRHTRKRILRVALPLTLCFLFVPLMLFNRDFLSGAPTLRIALWVLPLLGYPALFLFGHRLSQKHEFEADRLAVETMGNPAAFESMLGKMFSYSPTPYAHEVDDFSTHPAIGKRVKAIRNL